MSTQRLSLRVRASDYQELGDPELEETLNKSPRTSGGKFCARLRYKNLEIHKVFLRFLRLGGHKICSPTAHLALISVSLKVRGGA